MQMAEPKTIQDLYFDLLGQSAAAQRAFLAHLAANEPAVLVELAYVASDYRRSAGLGELGGLFDSIADAVSGLVKGGAKTVGGWWDDAVDWVKDNPEIVGTVATIGGAAVGMPWLGAAVGGAAGVFGGGSPPVGAGPQFVSQQPSQAAGGAMPGWVWPVAIGGAAVLLLKK